MPKLALCHYIRHNMSLNSLAVSTLFVGLSRLVTLCAGLGHSQRKSATLSQFSAAWSSALTSTLQFPWDSFNHRAMCCDPPTLAPRHPPSAQLQVEMFRASLNKTLLSHKEPKDWWATIFNDHKENNYDDFGKHYRFVQHMRKTNWFFSALAEVQTP